MQWLLIRLSNDLWSSDSQAQVAVPSRGCSAPEQTNGPSGNQVAATGSEREADVIFLMSHQPSGMEPRRWMSLAPNTWPTGRSVWKKSQSPCTVIHAEHPERFLRLCYHRASQLPPPIAQVNGAAVIKVTNSGLITSRIYVPRRAEPILLLRFTHLQTVLVCSSL